MDFVLYHMEKAYQSVQWKLPTDYLSRTAFDRALSRVDRLSSPGYPYCLSFTTNADCLGWDGFNYTRAESIYDDVCAFLRNPVPFYHKVFIKMEPHSLEKIKNKRFRLIIAQPLNIQMIWHMLFDYMNDKEIEQTYNIPSQQGVILPGGGWKVFVELWKRRGYDTGLDKSAWDWCTPWWLCKWDLEFRYRMGRGDNMDEWYSLAKYMYKCTFAEARLILGDGSIYQQIVPGVMKSGCVNTISSNSHMQVMVHILACLDQGVSIYPLPVACGDDTLQCSWQAVDINSYKKFGAIVKSASDGLEFVGHEFTMSGPIPLYLDKHLVKMMTVTNDNAQDYFDSMARMYCKNEYVFNFFRYMAEALGLRLYSRNYYNVWYDYET